MTIRVLLLIILQTSCYKARDSRYECGKHGRFEYCVDDIPGCVIGCHCHPGFYFDTDTKICEPNTKLTQNYRRNYVSEPSRIQADIQTKTQITEITSTAPNTVDTKIDQITKDADDLGDWLYNQFFKTIENQVINKTNSNGQLSWRSTGPKFVNKSQRRSNRFWKRSRRKKIKKGIKGNPRKKLLRITEDDSVFDSSLSSSDTSSDTSSSYSSSSSDSDSDTSRGHGHKKMVILSKKPKPPLPSFIFLPNIDTPFYPPMGLPPAPPIPMYSYVPVPPIGPFALVTAKSREENITGTFNTTAHTPVMTTTTTITTTAKEKTNEPEESSEKTLRLKGRSKKFNDTIKSNPRKKLLQKLRQTLKPKAQLSVMDYQKPASRFVDIDIPKENLASNLVDEAIPKNEVDFSYLTQLIHRSDKNIKNLPTQGNMETISPFDKASVDNFAPPQINNLTNTRHQFINNSEDSFYTSLGRQIASMIRRMDSEGQQHINIEIEKPDHKPSTLPLFFENVYSSPRSYWERSVRSPLNNYLKELEHIKKSNENLFSLENKVENEARKYSLTLPEIENIINEIEMAKSVFRNSNRKYDMPVPDKTLKFNLLPQHFYSNYGSDKNTPQSTKNITVENKINNKMLYQKFHGDKMPNKEFMIEVLPVAKKLLNTTKTITPSKIYTKHHDIAVKNIFKIPKHIAKLSLFRSSTSQKYKSNQTIPKSTTLKSGLKHHRNPTARQFNFRYFYGDNNQYEYEKNVYPVVLPNVRRYYKYVEKPAPSSYFHHELHHFDYFN